MFPDCSETIRRHAREGLFLFRFLEQRLLLLHCLRAENSEGVCGKGKHDLGHTCSSIHSLCARQKIRSKRESAPSDSPAPFPSLIKSAQTGEAGHWTKCRCKAWDSCTRRQRPSTGIVAVVAWPILSLQLLTLISSLLLVSFIFFFFPLFFFLEGGEELHR